MTHIETVDNLVLSTFLPVPWLFLEAVYQQRDKTKTYASDGGMLVHWFQIHLFILSGRKNECNYC